MINLPVHVPQLPHQPFLRFRAADLEFNPELVSFVQSNHYRPRARSGTAITCSVDGATAPSNFAIDGAESYPLAGVLILSKGCAYSSPSGRKDLVKRFDLNVRLDRLDRGEAVRTLGMAMISRVAVAPEFRELGIGAALAQVARSSAPLLFRGAKYVEVMTTRRWADAQSISQGRYQGGDFLMQAGYSVASAVSRVRWEVFNGDYQRTGLLYYYAKAG